MLSITSLIRLTKICVVLYASLFGFLVFFGNITDYNSNYEFVKHTLAMDTTFPGNALMYRSITYTPLYHMFYWFIIALEGLVFLTCLMGSFCMMRAFNTSAEVFHSAKRWAVLGFLIGITNWFFGFQVIGGEWFAMWQSTQWNGLKDAQRFVSYIFPALIFLCLKIDD